MRAVRGCGLILVGLAVLGVFFLRVWRPPDPSRPPPRPAAETPAEPGWRAPAETPRDENRRSEERPGEARSGAGQRGHWQEAAPGLEWWVRPIAEGTAELTLLRLNLERWGLEVVDVRELGKPAATVGELGRKLGAAAVINGGFFDEEGKPLGLLRHEGKDTNPLRQADWGVLLMRPGRAEIRHRREGVPAGTREALQSGPRLVIGGRIPRFKEGQAARSGVGIDAEGRVLLAVTSRGRITLEQFARALKALGCADALNLDGGGSTQLWARTGKLRLEAPGVWPVPSALAVREKAPAGGR